jgi:pyruvate dehydrogenase E2 component (dihydrolipoamide acetyltransferase)
MAKEFKLPELGENIDSGTVAKVLVAVGDTIAANQSVIEIETDKAVAEIPSPVAGVITELRVKEGQSIKPGEVILVVDEKAGAAAPEAKKEPPKEEKLAPAESKKAAPEPAPEPAAAREPKPEPQPAPAQERPPHPHGGAVLASPTVRRMAREMGVDLEDVPISDPSGRVTAQEIQNFAREREAGAPSVPAAETTAAKTPAASNQTEDSDRWGAVAREPMNAIRKKTVEHLTRCWTTIPQVTHFEKADITELEALRKRYGRKVDAAGGKLTITSFLLKILPEAFKRFPKFNASIDLDNQEVVYRKYCHIGVAVDTPNGLLVPVLRDVDQKSVTEVSVELPALAAKARDRKLKLEDMQGGTFTISNLGGLGGVGFTPIINAPEVAIMGVSRSSIEPVFINGQFAARTILPLSLTYDHRLIDGADAARFMRWVVEALEQPWVLFLEN